MARGVFAQGLGAGGAQGVVAAAALGLALALLVARLGVRLLPVGGEPSWRPPAHLGPGSAKLREVEPGLLLLGAAGVVVQLLGGPRSSLQPLVLLIVATLSALSGPSVVVLLVGYAGLVQLALLVGAAGESAEVFAGLGDAVGWFVAQMAFVALFAVSGHGLLHAEVVRLRRWARQHVRADLRRVREEAREFRLAGSTLARISDPSTRQDDEDRLARGAAETIHQSVYYLLELLKLSLSAHACVLLWLDESDRWLTRKEAVLDTERLVRERMDSGDGVVGAVVKERRPLRLVGVVPGYYGAAQPVGAFVGAPLLEAYGRDASSATHLRGVLCVDRLEARPFDRLEEALVVGAARQVLREVESERLFLSVEQSMYEQQRFYRGSELLSRALTPEQVYEQAIVAAREVVEFDFAAITLFDRRARRHTVCRVEGAEKERFEGLVFGDNAGLTSMVVKNRHYLPASGEVKEAESWLFTKRVPLRGMASLLVLPLVSADETVGTLALAATRAHAFATRHREMLSVLTNQIAVAVHNAIMYRRMEEMATTDGLTGLRNHRTFQERFTESLARAGRTGRPCALILTDVDHFKRINDTYGHPVGDQVLKRVAQVLVACARKIDLVARYGGEEFALVLEETDADGARQLAERIRLEVAKQSFSAAATVFHVTLSLGIAVCPPHGIDKAGLIERADQALYGAKQTGRNRSVVAGEAVARVYEPERVPAG
jgi:diguanylate cyclase (GGDEF)-like protein